LLPSPAFEQHGYRYLNLLFYTHPVP
jgi:hypothetical protein